MTTAPGTKPPRVCDAGVTPPMNALSWRPRGPLQRNKARRRRMAHFRAIRNVLVFTAFMSMLAVGLPAVPASTASAKSLDTAQVEQDASGCPVGLAFTPGEHCV